MSMMSLQTILHQLGHRSGARSLREALKLGRGCITVKERALPLKVMTYNMALMTPGHLYVGPSSFRAQAIDELCKRVSALQPDVVGLCEVYVDSERAQIRGRLKSLLPFFVEGPDEADLESDGGLLLLSKHPMKEVRSSIYRQTASPDNLSNKGVLFARIAPAGFPSSLDIFYTHAQAIYRGGDGQKELMSQLLHLGLMIRAHADPETPSLLMGDLNFPGEDPELYAKALGLLGQPIDLWLAQRPVPSEGATNVRDNNFYADPNEEGRPRAGEDHRLDYILLHPGLRHVPQLGSMEILKWSREGRQISDHFGVLARFSRELHADLELEGTIAGIDATITAVRCIEESDELGDDTVSFRLTVSTPAGASAESAAPKRVGVATGEGWTVTNATAARLAGDPGAQLLLRITGKEHDGGLNGDDSLGQRTLVIPRHQLLLHQGASLERVMPFLTGDGGEYAVTVRLTVR
ncbi:endonuclease/exonuclease/phosphatase family protein [Hyalangium sp.]|uniref:endonuclease/exonuclease/phosphatase family protein n=1 Tax=Hyalangium sp. TaxID=2028555 RepID=UPI002D6F8B6D|nr:endonuclease/exonuclease/phosphatase family protein [Hyalangium sp.]HYI01415.1 endonuclease/exonuclease/phosphatase family protein [Hyalangium sp.]